MKEASEKDIKAIVAKMKEESVDGAFYCDFQAFCQIYRLEARRILRLELEEYVLLFTAKDTTRPNGDASGTLTLEKEMDRLGGVLRKYLRIGDVVTRCSQTQYLVMLSVCRHESVKVVAQRILNMYDRMAITNRLSVRYDMAEITSANLESF